MASYVKPGIMQPDVLPYCAWGIDVQQPPSPASRGRGAAPPYSYAIACNTSRRAARRAGNAAATIPNTIANTTQIRS